MDGEFQSKNHLLAILDNMPYMAWYKDIHGKFIAVNQPFADGCGKSKDEIIGKTDFDIWSYELAVQYAMDDQEVIRTKCKKTVEEPIKDQSGGVWFETFKSPVLDLEGNVIGTIGMASDVSQRKNFQINKEETIQLCNNGSVIEVETAKTPFYDENGEIAGLIGIARDITSRKILETKMKEQNDYAKMLLRTVPSAVYTIDNNKIITSWNEMAEKITGYSADEVMGTSIESYLFHPCRNNCGLFLDEIITPQSNLTSIIQNKNGEVKYLLKNVDVIKNTTKEVIGRIECFSDITERVLVEQQLKESEMRLQLATGIAKIGLWDWKVQTGELVLNESWATILNYTLKELHPMNINTWRNLVHPEDFDKTMLLLTKNLSGELNYYESEYRIRNKNGEWIWVLDRGKIIEWDAQKNPLRMLGTYIDITARKRTEEELNKKEKLLSAVALSIKELLDNRDYFQAIAKCFELLGQATLVDRVYLFINHYDHQDNGFTSQAIEWNSGISEAQMDNPNLQNIPFKEIENFITPLKNKETYSGIVKELKNDMTRELLESQHILSIIVLPIYVRNAFWGFVGFDECKYDRLWTESEFSTLSAFVNSIERTVERSLVEKDLEESRINAEAANILKSQFVANMSHEIRTPMHAILGYAALMKDLTESNQAILYLDAIQKAGNNLMNLINDILDLSKIESGKLEMETSYADSRRLFTDIKDIFSLGLEEKNLELFMEIDEKIPKMILIDELRLRQILFNLVGNAVKFTNKGFVRVSAKAKNFDVKNKKLDLVFEVADTGIGIPNDQQLSIFDPFKQKDGQSNKKYGGTGLGLSISKRLIDMMSGSITLYSQPNKGTTFFVTIPNLSIRNESKVTSKTGATHEENLIRDRKKVASLDNSKSKNMQIIDPNIIEKLELLQQGLWLECNNNNRVSDIRKLADCILEIGTAYRHEETIHYASTLQAHINTFNLKNIKDLLDQYPPMLERYKSTMNKEGNNND